MSTAESGRQQETGTISVPAGLATGSRTRTYNITYMTAGAFTAEATPSKQGTYIRLANKVTGQKMVVFPESVASLADVLRQVLADAADDAAHDYAVRTDSSCT